MEKFRESVIIPISEEYKLQTLFLELEALEILTGTKKIICIYDTKYGLTDPDIIKGVVRIQTHECNSYVDRTTGMRTITYRDNERGMEGVRTNGDEYVGTLHYVSIVFNQKINRFLAISWSADFESTFRTLFKDKYSTNDPIFGQYCTAKLIAFLKDSIQRGGECNGLVSRENHVQSTLKMRSLMIQRDRAFSLVSKSESLAERKIFTILLHKNNGDISRTKSDFISTLETIKALPEIEIDNHKNAYTEIFLLTFQLHNGDINVTLREFSAAICL